MEDFFNNLNFSNIIWQILAPLLFMLIDVVTGYVQAVINKNVDSGIMREGLLHKFLLILIVISSFILDYTFNIKVSVGICVYIIIMELTSILENFKKAGIDLPILKIFNKEDKKDGIK